MHDIFSFVACGVTTPRLIEECPDLLSLRPTTQEIQVASIRAIPVYRYDKFEIIIILIRNCTITCTPATLERKEYL